MHTTMRNLIHDESGAAATEYALIAGLIAIAIILALTTLGEEIAEVLGLVSDELDDVEVPTADAG